MFRRCGISLLVLAFASTAQAAELISIEVDHDSGTYKMNSVVWFDASVEQVYQIFRYWDYSTKFSSTIVESRDLEPDEQGRPQFYVRNRGCVLFFCQSFERSGYVEAEIDKWLRAFANPDVSDFNFSNERWKFETRNGGTVVVYDLEMSPKFWIPPGIGPFLIKRKLKNNGGDAIDRIEALAQGVGNE